MIQTSILIPAKDEALNIRNCLDSVFSQASNNQFEVILVDSGSTDGTPEIVESYPVRLYRIPAKEFHHARTRNYLASLAQGKYLVYLNADAFPTSPNWLNSLISNFSDPSIGAAYGRHLPKLDCNLERRVVLSAIYGEAVGNGIPFGQSYDNWITQALFRSRRRVEAAGHLGRSHAILAFPGRLAPFEPETCEGRPGREQRFETLRRRHPRHSQVRRSIAWQE